MMRTAGSRCALILAVLLFCTPALAHDWTGTNDPELARWFMSLQRKIDHFSCCGVSEGYSIRILREADPNRPKEDTGIAEILDGRELTLQGGVHRMSLPDGLQFRFSYDKLTSENSGNPTPFQWAFLSVDMGHIITRVYCVVPLLPGT